MARSSEHWASFFRGRPILWVCLRPRVNDIFAKKLGPTHSCTVYSRPNGLPRTYPFSPYVVQFIVVIHTQLITFACQNSTAQRAVMRSPNLACQR